MDEDWSERLVADRTGGIADNRVIAYGPSPASGPPVPAVGEGPQRLKRNSSDQGGGLA